MGCHQIAFGEGELSKIYENKRQLLSLRCNQPSMAATVIAHGTEMSRGADVIYRVLRSSIGPALPAFCTVGHHEIDP